MVSDAELVSTLGESHLAGFHRVFGGRAACSGSELRPSAVGCVAREVYENKADDSPEALTPPRGPPSLLQSWNSREIVQLHAFVAQ